MIAEAHLTRVDGYYDDQTRHVEPETVAQAFRDGQALSHLARVREIRQYQGRARPDGPMLVAGVTTYLGSPKSEAMVRVYDKAAESGNAGAGVRWEVQLRGKRAGLFLMGAIAAGDHLGAHVLGTIRGLVDFRARPAGVRGDRGRLLDWWAAIVGDADRVTLSLPAKQDSLGRRARWLGRQVAPTLALVGIGYGTDWLNALVEAGEERLTRAQLALVGVLPGPSEE